VGSVSGSSSGASGSSRRGSHIEERHPIGGGQQATEELAEAITEEAGFSRRKLLIGALGGTLAGWPAALAIPVLSLGPAPGKAAVPDLVEAGREARGSGAGFP
jgi:acetylornithine deacetylase/succinyl-diaminopimelate desuccinylase-like protein